MTFLELQTELYARGLDYLNQDAAGRTRAKRWLNEAYLEDICGSEPWAFLEATTSGAAPLTISDLRDVIYVVDSTHKSQLKYTPIRDLVDYDTDLTTTGSPLYWYETSETAIAVYPANTSVTISVRYFKVPTELSADVDTPIAPSRMHSLIVDFAMIRAYYDSDNVEAATAMEQRAVNRLQRFSNSLLYKSSDPSYIVQLSAID